MKINGSLDSIQSNINYYLKLTSVGNLKNTDGLRKYYFDKFMSDARRNMSMSADLVSESEEIHGTFIDDIIEEVSEGYKEEIIEEVESVSVSNSNNAKGFLAAVNASKSETNEDIIINENLESNIEIHGTFLEDIDTSIIEDENIEDNYEESSNIGYENEVEIKEVEEIEEVEVHGIFLEDVEDVVESAEEILPFEGNDLSSEDDQATDDLIDSSEDIFTYTGSEENYEPVGNIVNFPDSESGEMPLEVSERDEPVVVPSTVREFLKKHPGSEVSYVEQYYSKKDISKELKLGKIYKKGNKLFI